MNTNLPPEITQIIPLLPTWYQVHWPALMLATGILTHAAHRIVALGGLRGMWKLIWMGSISGPQPTVANPATVQPPISEPKQPPLATVENK